MDKFGKIKQVMVDKPVFKLVGDDEPVQYKLKQQTTPAVPTQAPQQVPTIEDSKLDQPEEIQGSLRRNPVTQQQVRQAVKNPYEQLPPSQQDNYQPTVMDWKPDDDASVKMNTEDILTMDGTDAMLDELENMDEYDMTPRDRKIVHDQVYKYLLDNGLIGKN